MSIRLVKPEYTLDELAARLTEAKKAEQLAVALRREIEEQIVDAVGVQTEGSFTAAGDHYKITTTGKVNRTVDEDKLHEIWDELPEPLMQRLFPVKHSLNVKELHYVENNEPDWYKVVARAITAKPGKPQVKVTEIEKDGR